MVTSKCFFSGISQSTTSSTELCSLLWQSAFDNWPIALNPQSPLLIKNLYRTIWFSMIDPVTHVTRRKEVHLTQMCILIWPGFNTGEDCCVCTTQAICSITLLNYYAGTSSCALHPPTHEKTHVNIHQHSCKNIHNIVAANDNGFCLHFNSKLLHKK